MDKTYLVTLNITTNYQPTTEVTGKTAEFYCYPATFRVDYIGEFGSGSRYGQWNSRDEAFSFAESFRAYTQNTISIVECEPYLWAPAFGKVDAQPVRSV